MRIEFQLPSDDLVYLETLAIDWETVMEGKSRWLLLHGFMIPKCYNHQKVSAAIQITPGYPDSQLDMVYFCPTLSRLDGKSIGATQHSESIDGKTWQRWSRHRTQDAPWRAGVDCVMTHITLINDWLQREFT